MAIGFQIKPLKRLKGSKIISCIQPVPFNPFVERGFIKAEVVSFKELDEAGSMAEAKACGKVRMEGKDYIMQGGDVVEFRFNV